MLTPYQQAIANLYNQCSNTYDQGEFHPKLVDLLLNYLDIKPKPTVLDIATGTGLIAVEVAKKVGGDGYVVGGDIAELMLKKAQEKAQIFNLNNLECLQADIESLELPKEPFERISCCAAIVMFNDITNLFNRCYDWLKLGGKIGFNYWSETSFIEGYILSKIAPKYNIIFPHGHKKIGSKETCYNLLKSVRLKNIEIHQDQLGHYVDLETVKNKWEMMLNFPVTNDKIFPFQTLSQEQLKEVKQDYYQELEIRVTPKGVWNEIMTLTVIAEK